MNHSSKIYVSGHRGMVGSAMMRRLERDGFTNIITRTHKELDLTRQADVEAFFAAEQPEYVFHTAARAGGILANSTFPADFMYENLAIEMNVIHAAAKNGAKKLLFIASTSVYPRDAKQPVSETSMLTGTLETTNAAYALAKITGIKLCEYCNRQYGTDFISVTPPNLYGFNDHYDYEYSHVIPSLIRKFAEASAENAPCVEVWGSGKAYREFLHADDLADACLFLMEHYSGNAPINIGTGQDIQIADVVALLRDVSGFNGNVIWDTSKPDGCLRRRTDCSKLSALGWKTSISFPEGLKAVYDDYIRKHAPEIRGDNPSKT